MKNPPDFVFAISHAVVLLMSVTSLAGLLFPSIIYPTEDLRRAFLANDVVNLFIGLPILLVSMGLARRGRLIGLLFWPGALFYVTYNYIAYAVAMPWTLTFVLFLALVTLSAYAIFRLLSSMDLTAVQSQLKGKVAERLCGGVLAGFGVLFFLRGLAQLAQGTVNGAEGTVVIADLFTTPFWVIGGILLWRKQPLGYATGAGLLFQASMLFVGLLVFFILQPFVTSVPFPLTDFVVILVMALVVFVPFGRFVRVVILSEKRIVVV